MLVRHAKPVVDTSVPAAEWALSAEGRAAAAELGRQLVLPAASVIVTSTEPKAIETGAALTRSPVATSVAFCEVTRPFYDAPGELERHVAEWFAGETVDGWEPRSHAVARFARGVAERNHEHLVVVTHGTVMTAWLASMELVDDPLGFWRDLRMPDAWSVERRGVQRYPAA
jgi:broad specificity phosphatase PhoE